MSGYEDDFSNARFIISEKRSSLKPKNAEMIIMFSHNLKSIDILQVFICILS